MDTVIILLTWKRPRNLISTLNQLSRQFYKDFDIHVSNGDLSNSELIDSIAKKYSQTTNMSISVTHDGNQYSCFRRFFIAKDYAKLGYKKVMFLDDDILIPQDYVKRFQESYQPKTYQSAYTWVFREGGKDYYRYRTRVFDNELEIKYAGAGVAMVDASVFLEDGLMNPPKEAYQIDDLWMSYYCNHVMGWKIKNVNVPDLNIGGGDSVALYRSIRLNQRSNKATFLRHLVRLGWKV
jgi:glycosyltransferase involved in cell wall biosynthesis